jgi:Mn-dependent DtxR family transcriptional regulator
MTKHINDSSHWREFEQNNITHSAAHYLMAIDALRDELGYARVTDVAEMLEVSRGAASMSISQLKKRGWVNEDPNRFLLLSEEGLQMANRVESNFRILSKFLEGVLGIDKAKALGDACKMEHLMSLETGRRLVLLMQYIMGDDKRSSAVKTIMEDLTNDCSSVETCPVCGGENECLAAAVGLVPSDK